MYRILTMALLLINVVVFAIEQPISLSNSKEHSHSSKQSEPFKLRDQSIQEPSKKAKDLILNPKNKPASSYKQIVHEKLKGQSTGNSGDTDELIISILRRRETLNEQDILEVVKDMGESIKNEVLIPIFTYFLKEYELSDNERLNEIFEVLKRNEEKLLLDIKLTHIKVGYCSGSPFCTGSEPYSDIIIDLDSFSETIFGMEISELLALIAHEFLHHYFDEIIEHDKYHLASYFVDIIEKDHYQVKVYNFKDTLLELSHLGYSTSEDSFNTHAVLDASKSGDEYNASQSTLFCKKMGHKSSKSYEISSFTNADDLKMFNILPKKSKTNNLRYYRLRDTIDGQFLVKTIGTIRYDSSYAYFFKKIECYR